MWNFSYVQLCISTEYMLKLFVFVYFSCPSWRLKQFGPWTKNSKQTDSPHTAGSWPTTSWNSGRTVTSFHFPWKSLAKNGKRKHWTGLVTTWHTARAQVVHCLRPTASGTSRFRCTRQFGWNTRIPWYLARVLRASRPNCGQDAKSHRSPPGYCQRGPRPVAIGQACAIAPPFGARLEEWLWGGSRRLHISTTRRWKWPNDAAHHHPGAV